VPAELEPDRLCLHHFTVTVEHTCSEMRRETAGGNIPSERRAEILRALGDYGSKLARIATGSPRLPDEMKARILNTFLTLMNLRENIERALARRSA
jgi:hypothetical protein